MYLVDRNNHFDKLVDFTQKGIRYHVACHCKSLKKTKNKNSVSFYDLDDRNTLEIKEYQLITLILQLAWVAQLDVPSDWRPGGRGFNPCRGRQHSFVEIDHEIFSPDSRRAVVSFWQKNVHNTG